MENKEYKTNQLFLAVACPVYMHENGSRISTKDKQKNYVIVQEEANSYFDVILEKKYEYFENVDVVYMKYHLDKFYITRLTPLHIYLKQNGNITMTELLALYNKLNGIKEQKVRLPIIKPDIQDPFLQEIMKTKLIISEDMKENIKEGFIQELSNLSEYYVSLITSLIERGEADEKLKVIAHCMPTLVDIECRIKDYNKKGVPKDNLIDDLENLMKMLKK